MFSFTDSILLISPEFRIKGFRSIRRDACRRAKIKQKDAGKLMAMELEREDEQLLQFMYSCPIGLVEVAADGAIGMMNPFAMKLLLPIARTPVITNFFAIMEPYAPELRNLADAFTAPSGEVCENQRILVHPGTKAGDYEARVLSCTLVRINNRSFIATLSDISAQVAQERRLQQAETWFASLLDDVDKFAIVSLDAQGKIDGVNGSVLRQTGLNDSETIGRTLDIFDMPGTASGTLNVTEQLSLARRDGWHLTELWQNCSGGKPYWCQRLIAVRSGDEGPGGWTISGYTVVLREVTQHLADVSKLAQMLSQDYLTGVCNRSNFFKVAGLEWSRSIRYAKPLAVVVIDVDHFKFVNDTYGHGAGDLVLKSIAESCTALVRPSDTFARLSGQEFVVLLPSTDTQGAGQLAERFRVAIAATPISVKGGAVLHVTASFGCAEMNAQAKTLPDLLAAADKALHAAKEAGRDRVVLWSPALADA